MATYKYTPTGRERHFQPDEIIVSKTDTKGRITYVNRVFMQVAGYTESELIGQPHALIRHPEMPRAVFKLLWDHIGSGKEIFAYVVNMCKGGDHYWVFAHVTPTFDASGSITGYHSSRRVARPEALSVIKPIYNDLLAIEAKHGNAKEGMNAAFQALVDKLEGQGVSYDEFIMSL